MRRYIERGLVHLLLLAGASLFLLPLIWMLSTALKPIEQTMSIPPTWIPYQYFVTRGGESVPVRLGESIDVPSCVVRRKDTGARLLVPRSALSNGALRQSTPQGVETLVPIEVLKDIAASPDTVWVRVMPENLPSSEWDVAEVGNIVRRVAPRWENFGRAIAAMKYFPAYLMNTLLLCVLTVVGAVFSSALAAYGFSRINWPGRNKVFILALATMMIPFPVLMVPMYCLFRWLGWIGTLRPLWVGSFFAGAFNVFLLRQFFMTLPKDLSEAARIDGCGEFRIFWQITLPLCRPALMVVGLFQFMFTWNDFLGPLIYLTDQKDFTLALGLQFFQSQHGGTEWHYLMAAGLLVALPIIVLFFFTQRSFVEGISMTGVKG